MLLLAGFRPARSRWRRLVVRSKTWKEEGVAAEAAAAVARRRRAIELRRRRAGGGIEVVGEGREGGDDVGCGLGLVGDFFGRIFLNLVIFVQKLEFPNISALHYQLIRPTCVFGEDHDLSTSSRLSLLSRQKPDIGTAQSLGLTPGCRLGCEISHMPNCLFEPIHTLLHALTRTE